MSADYSLMERKIITTSDGSNSLFLPDWDEQYHSKHGAIQEAYHVFIKNGLDLFSSGEEVSILEMGFGTGLNCLISYLEGVKRHLQISYLGIEAYPLMSEITEQLNYPKQLKAASFAPVYAKMHSMPWETSSALSENFSLLKKEQRFEDFDADPSFNLIYFDAFGARVQPELWTEDIFTKMFRALKPNGVLVTYSAKGSVRRAMQASGFTVERLEGPPGKREMLRARKI